MKLPPFSPGADRSLAASPSPSSGVEPQLKILDKIIDWALGNSFYAGCYWACVVDTGGWQTCGPVCRKLEKDAKDAVGL